MTATFHRSIALSTGNGTHGKASPGIAVSWTFKGKAHFVWATVRGFYHSAI